MSHDDDGNQSDIEDDADDEAHAQPEQFARLAEQRVSTGSENHRSSMSRDSSARSSAASKRSGQLAIAAAAEPFSRQTSARSSAGSRRHSMSRMSPSRSSSHSLRASAGGIAAAGVFSRESSARQSASSDRANFYIQSTPSTQTDLLTKADLDLGNEPMIRNSAGRHSDSRILAPTNGLARDSPGRWSNGKTRRRTKRNTHGSVSMQCFPQGDDTITLQKTLSSTFSHKRSCRRIIQPTF